MPRTSSIYTPLRVLVQVKLIQTGVLTKYRNAKRLRVVVGLFKHSLGLRTVALCVNWWSEDYLQVWGWDDALVFSSVMNPWLDVSYMAVWGVFV